MVGLELQIIKNFFKILQSIRKDKYEIVIITDIIFRKEKKTFVI